MKPTLLALAFISSAAYGQTAPDTSSLTARLGIDTIAVERIVRNGNIVDAEIVVRSPKTSLQRHHAEFGANGMLSRLEVTALDPATASVQRLTTYMMTGDSVRIVDNQNGKDATRSIAASRSALPFIDLVHWPFEVVLRRLRASGSTSIDAPMLTGSRVSAFPIALIGADSATVTHPTRGTMRLRVGPGGSIQTLDAGATTRALVVTRGRNVDVGALARDFAARDARGKGIGELSGRGGDTTSILGAKITLDYGTPVKRGRAIWGALVPYGKLWRTGANTATHFTTNTPLRFGTLNVPAGKYTLYSIPEANGGWLIINRQTGQNGQQYDEKQDLGRVRLEARNLSAPVEVFTISTREETGKGILALQWDERELIARFEVVR